MISVNKAGADWLVIKGWLKTKINDAHADMERGMSQDDYHLARGRVAICRALIEEVEPTTPPKTIEDDYGISTQVD